MRPTPIPNEEIWVGAKRVVVGPPDGDITGNIAPVEALVECAPDVARHRISVRCVLEEGELEQLQQGGAIWVSFYGVMPPTELRVMGPFT